MQRIKDQMTELFDLHVFCIYIYIYNLYIFIYTYLVFIGLEIATG